MVEFFRGSEKVFCCGFGGPVAATGLVSPVGLTGVHLLEHRGYISKFTIGLLVGLAVAAAGNTVHVGSKTETFGGTTYRTDYYRTLTADEQATRNQLASDAYDEDYVVELNAYSPGLLPVAGLGERVGASGFELYLGIPFKPEGHLPVIFQLAFGGSYIGVADAEFKAGQGPNGSANPDANHLESFHSGNLGARVRVIVPVTAFGELHATWDLNLLQALYQDEEFDRRGALYTSPFRLGATLNLSDRFFGTVTGSVNAFSLEGLGVAAEIGVRL